MKPNLCASINSNNRITNTGFTYDAAGDLLTDGSNTYTWNAEGRMVTAAGVTYTYDGDGKRVKKSNGTLYWYGPGGEVLAESDLAGNILWEYIYFNGQRVARRDPVSGTAHYYLADRLGSARVIAKISSSGAYQGVVEESDFYPYGTERPITNDPNTPDNPYKFTGHERDSESGLDHTLSRQYSSNTGRWLSSDPKLGTGKPADPQSWNRYSYGNNSPCNASDPDGGEVHWNFDEAHPAPAFHSQEEAAAYERFLKDLYEDEWNSLPESCRKGLSEAHPTNTIKNNIDALNQAHSFEAELRKAFGGLVTPPGVDWTMLAAIGIRESNFANLLPTATNRGAGIFQIDLGKNPGVTQAQALDPDWAANWGANTLAANAAALAHWGFDAAHLAQATAASWNIGTDPVKGITGNPNTIDVGTAGGNYGSNVMNIASCFR